MPDIIAQDRDALYYPHIHIHDVNWLKSTLLCFPSVRRIVPEPWNHEALVEGDNPEIQEFCRTIGARGPLLQPCKLNHAYASTDDLCRNMQEHEDELLPKYSWRVTRAKYGDDNCYKLHDSKFSYALNRYLEEKQLGWRDDDHHWVMIHPKLGEAIMSTIALGVARLEGLDIVTASDKIHCVASLSDEREVFENLLRHQPLRTAPAREDLPDALAEVVMTTLFDVERLTAEQVAELQKDGKDLRRFKSTIASAAAELPDIADPKERTDRLKRAAEEVIEEWHKYRRTLPRFALDALIDAGNIKPPEWSAALLAGASAHHFLGAGLGIVVGVLAYSGTKVVRAYRKHRDNPYRYLTRIYREGATLKTPTTLLDSKQGRLKF